MFERGIHIELCLAVHRLEPMQRPKRMYGGAIQADLVHLFVGDELGQRGRHIEFAALDEQTRMVLGEDLSVLLAHTRKTIVFVTHSLVEAIFLADRVAVFTARPGRIKQIISVNEPHPRKRGFMTSSKLSQLRNELYELLHDEIRRTMSLRTPEAGDGEKT